MSSDSSLMTSYTTPFYRRFRFSTLRNSSALELLVYLAIGMIHSEILALPCPYRRTMSLSILLLMFVLTCLSSMIPRWICSENSLPTTSRETPTFSSSEIICFFCIPSDRVPLPPRIWDHKLVSDVSAPPDFRQC